ncbi:MAG: flagellar biosynthesis regulator FlaF [Alphaproteobacteria bacterium]|nr:flagellar biosynthesis regulator FlaF [Alphaproteobacteria bacterium]
MPYSSKGQHGTYTSHQREGETVRETDARALLSCASRMEAARRPDSTEEDYVEALRHNQQLWTVFQICLTEPDNTLPKDVKLMLLNLSRYVDKVSFRALTEYNTDLLIGLININRQIAAGLSTGQKETKSPTSEEPPTPPPAPGSVMTTA